MNDLKKRRQDLMQNVPKHSEESNKRIYLIILIVSVIAIVGLIMIGFVRIDTKEEQKQEQLQEVLTAEHEIEQVQEPVPEEHVTVIELDKGQEYYEAEELFARVLHCENSNEVDGEEATWETASEIMNRVNDPDYPDNIVDVIYQKGQFDCLKNLYRENPTDIEYEIAADVLENGSRSPADIVFGAEFVQGSGVYKKIGNTYYCHK